MNGSYCIVFPATGSDKSTQNTAHKNSIPPKQTVRLMAHLLGFLLGYQRFSLR